MGDERLSNRLVESARVQAEKPGESFIGAAQGNWPQVKGYYRMIDKPDDSAISMAAILAPHRERTLQRMKAQHTVLCIQDGTDLNYNSLAQCEGLGVIGTNQASAQSCGLHLHSTLVVTTDGLPLGLLGAQCVAPEGKQEEKKNFCWIESLRDSNALATEMPSTHQIDVLDREADFYEIFCEPRHRQVDLLVRAKYKIGFALYPFSLQQPDLVPWEQVATIADRGAYVAKENGRNAWVGLYGTRSTTTEDLSRIKHELNVLVEKDSLRIKTSIAGELKLAEQKATPRAIG